MMPWEDVAVQLIDTPPITADYMDSHLHGLIRAADLALLLVDLGSDNGIEQCRTCSTICRRRGPGWRRSRSSTSRTWACPTRARSWCRTRSTCPSAAERLDLLHELLPLDFSEYVISAAHGTGLEALREAIYRSLDMVRIYSKLPSAKEPDRDRPFTVRRGSTLLEMAGLVHKDFLAGLKFARVWGRPSTTAPRSRAITFCTKGRGGAAHVISSSRLEWKKGVRWPRQRISRDLSNTKSRISAANSSERSPVVYP